MFYTQSTITITSGQTPERAQSAYKDIRVIMFISSHVHLCTHTHMHAHTHIHTHTHSYQYMYYRWWVGRLKRKKIPDQYAEEKRWVFSFDLREWRWMPDRERKRVPVYWTGKVLNADECCHQSDTRQVPEEISNLCFSQGREVSA